MIIIRGEKYYQEDLTMNIWHDIDPKRISPDDFVAVIEIPKKAKLNMN